MNDIRRQFALLKELEREHAEVLSEIESLIAEMERVPEGERSAGEWGPSGTSTRRFISLSERQRELEADIRLAARAVDRAQPPGRVN